VECQSLYHRFCLLYCRRRAWECLGRLPRRQICCGPPPPRVVIFLCPVCQLIKLQEGWCSNRAAGKLFWFLGSHGSFSWGSLDGWLQATLCSGVVSNASGIDDIVDFIMHYYFFYIKFVQLLHVLLLYMCIL